MRLLVGILLVTFKFSSVHENSAHALPSAAAVTADAINIGEVLCEAARNGNLSLVTGILSIDGVHVDETDARGWTALMWASRYGHEPVVDFLLEQGANEDHQSHTGDSSLLWASYGGFDPIVNTFLAMEVDPDITEEKGITPLMAAAVAGNTDIVEILLDAGADKDIRDKLGFNALMVATRTGQNDVIPLLTDYDAVNSRDNWGWTPLHHAVSLNTSSGVEALVELLSACPDLGITASIGPNNWTATDFAIGINNIYAFTAFQGHLGKSSATCILDSEEYSFSEVVSFDCRQFQCHCYGHWLPVGNDPDCRDITLEVLASQDLIKSVKFSSVPNI